MIERVHVVSVSNEATSSTQPYDREPYVLSEMRCRNVDTTIDLIRLQKQISIENKNGPRKES